MCQGAWSYIVDTLRWICGDPRRRRDTTEKEKLLSKPSDPEPGTPAADQHLAGLTAATLDSLNGAPSHEEAKVIVMRHGHRQDEEDPYWHQSAKRPWDPPLSARGRAQVIPDAYPAWPADSPMLGTASAMGHCGVKLSEVTYIVISPQQCHS